MKIIKEHLKMLGLSSFNRQEYLGRIQYLIEDSEEEFDLDDIDRKAERYNLPSNKRIQDSLTYYLILGKGKQNPFRCLIKYLMKKRKNCETRI